MKKILISALLLVLSAGVFAQVISIPTKSGDVKVTPISHASMVWEWKGLTIYIDPTGGKIAYSKFKSPDFIFITDIHGDHMDVETLQALDLTRTTVIGPEAVLKNLERLRIGQFKSMRNGAMTDIHGILVEAIPMYNLTAERRKFHPPGRGNGYVITVAGTRIYVSGDTEDIPEMRSLRNIDVAFICMNLPYTMTEEQAASAVLAFKPKTVYPYHYRGADEQMSDPEKFKSIVQSTNMTIKVVVLDWYPN